MDALPKSKPLTLPPQPSLKPREQAVDARGIPYILDEDGLLDLFGAMAKCSFAAPKPALASTQPREPLVRVEGLKKRKVEVLEPAAGKENAFPEPGTSKKQTQENATELIKRPCLAVPSSRTQAFQYSGSFTFGSAPIKFSLQIKV